MVKLKATPFKGSEFSIDPKIDFKSISNSLTKPTINLEANYGLGSASLRIKNGHVDGYSGSVNLPSILPFISGGATVTTDPPPSSLLPIKGTNFYTTPLEPISPTDCQHYPESPFCGGNPLSNKPLNLDVQLTATPCSIAITAQPTLAFIKLPAQTFAYIAPGCIPPPEPLPDYKSEGDYRVPVQLPNNSCGTSNSNTAVLILSSSVTSISRGHYHGGTLLNRFNEEEFYGEGTTDCTLNYFEYPYEGSHKVRKLGVSEQGQAYFYDATPLARISINIQTKNVTNHAYAVAFGDGVNQLNNVENSTFETYYCAGDEGNDYFKIFFCQGNSLNQIDFGNSYKVSNTLSLEDVANDDFFAIGRYPHIDTDEKIYQAHIRCGYNTSIDTNPPLPLFKPPKDDDMGCCDLVAVLLKKVERLEKVIGVDEYPASLPDSLITKQPKGFVEGLVDKVTGDEPKNIEIPNLTRLFEWYVRRFDEVMGQFEIPIRVSPGEGDTSTEKVGSMNLPNVSESIAEMVGLLLHISYNSELLVNMGTRTLLEAGQTKQQGFRTYMVSEAIMEYLGFKHKEENHKIAMMFDPEKHNLHELLQEREMDVSAIEFDDKYNLRHNLVDLLQAAAIIRATHFRKLNKSGLEMTKEIVDIVKGIHSMSKGLDKGPTDKSGLDDFDRFLKDAESEFLNVKDPWGEDNATRPKITRLTPRQEPHNNPHTNNPGSNPT